MLEDTHFAPAERCDQAALREQILKVSQHPLVTELLQALGSVALVLNEQRQVVAHNKHWLSALGLDLDLDLTGLRPGEILDCAVSRNAPSGCGTGDGCRSCGAVLSILASQRGEEAIEQECLITREHEGYSQDHAFMARCARVDVDEHTFYLLTLRSIQQRKQAEVLERVFLHDQINLLQGLRGLSELLVQDSVDHRVDPELAAELQKLTTSICEATTSQRDLILLESGVYRLDLQHLSAAQLVRDLQARLAQESVSLEKRVRWPEIAPSWRLCTDATLARRVLRCMLDNALEAADGTHPVCLQAQQAEGWIRWSVSNPGGMKPAVRDRIFQRHFSTKAGRGRGLGTYCIKLIGERSLGGKVGFDVAGDEVTFYFALPLDG